MVPIHKPVIQFGDKYFVDVTNETTDKETFSLAEAKVLGGEHRRMYSSRQDRR